MEQHGKHTRKDKFEKRRKDTKSISILLVVGVILLLSLIGIWLFGGGSNEAVDETEQGQEDNKENDSVDDLEEDVTDENESSQNADTDDEPETSTGETGSNDEDDEMDEEVVTEKVEPSDNNVREALVGDWQPVGTEQEGPHTVDFSDNSQDRLEMREAILSATGLNESDYHEWWLGNGGDQKVIATVSDEEETEVYRVYLSWIDNEGWQPTKLELLIENDWDKYQ